MNIQENPLTLLGRCLVSSWGGIVLPYLIRILTSETDPQPPFDHCIRIQTTTVTKYVSLCVCQGELPGGEPAPVGAAWGHQRHAPGTSCSSGMISSGSGSCFPGHSGSGSYTTTRGQVPGTLTNRDPDTTLTRGQVPSTLTNRDPDTTLTRGQVPGTLTNRDPDTLLH